MPSCFDMELVSSPSPISFKTSNSLAVNMDARSFRSCFVRLRRALAGEGLGEEPGRDEHLAQARPPDGFEHLVGCRRPGQEGDRPRVDGVQQASRTPLRCGRRWSRSACGRGSSPPPPARSCLAARNRSTPRPPRRAAPQRPPPRRCGRCRTPLRSVCPSTMRRAPTPATDGTPPGALVALPHLRRPSIRALYNGLYRNGTFNFRSRRITIKPVSEPGRLPGRPRDRRLTPRFCAGLEVMLEAAYTSLARRDSSPSRRGRRPSTVAGRPRRTWPSSLSRMPTPELIPNTGSFETASSNS